MALASAPSFGAADDAVQGGSAEPLARFGIVSDVHIITHDWQRWHRSGVFRDALKYMDRRKADGVVACGDLTQNGTTNELQEFAAVWDSVFPVLNERSRR